MNLVIPEFVGLSSNRLGRIDTLLKNRVEQGQIAGAVTLLARHGQLVHLGCQGLLEIASNRPMQPDAIFRIFSMTKQVTTLAV